MRLPVQISSVAQLTHAAGVLPIGCLLVSQVSPCRLWASVMRLLWFAAGWGGTLGVNWQRAKCTDEHGRALTQDVYGSPLTFSGRTSDTMMLALLRAVYRCLPVDAVPHAGTFHNARHICAFVMMRVEVLLLPLPQWISGPGGRQPASGFHGASAADPFGVVELQPPARARRAHYSTGTLQPAALWEGCAHSHQFTCTKPFASPRRPCHCNSHPNPVAGGMIFGDLPPYEAFPIGGTNSVRGYSEGGVGSGRNYAAGTAELHWPLFKPVEVWPSRQLSCCKSFELDFNTVTSCTARPGIRVHNWRQIMTLRCRRLQGTLFLDYGTDLDSGMQVLGDPAGARGKPGTGYGYGAGIRVDSPVGPLRLEYAFNDTGKRRFHLGIGSHG